jgi:hypothetical protein
VTIPFTFETFWPSFGDRCAAPWMSWIGVGGATVANAKT